jgi:hypothetical protein
MIDMIGLKLEEEYTVTIQVVLNKLAGFNKKPQISFYQTASYKV